MINLIIIKKKIVYICTKTLVMTRPWLSSSKFVIFIKVQTVLNLKKCSFKNITLTKFYGSNYTLKM